MPFTFFAVQIAIRAFHKDPLRARLHQAISRAPREQTLFEKRTFWKEISALVNEAMPVFEYGFWDLVRGGNAQEEFETWCSEIEGSLATEGQEMGGAADEVNRLSADKKYLLVSMLLLVERGSNSDLTLGDRCDLPESEYWSRQTLARLVATIPLLNFATVRADAVYLVPGNEEDGLSDDDLHAGGYEYLKPLG